MLKEGDYVRALEDHGEFAKVNKGSYWEVDQVINDEETGETYYVGTCLDGTRSGYTLDADKVEVITENIPFRVAATVQIDVIATVYADSAKDAVQRAKSNYSELLDEADELDGSVVSAWLSDF